MEGVTSLSPAANGLAITPSDTTDLPNDIRGLLVGGAGNVKVDFIGVGTGIVLTGLLAGTIYPVQVSRVYVTSTTATSLVGLY